MSKDIKKALEHCVEWKCDNCPNGDDLGSGETVCRGRLLPQVLEYVADLESKLAEMERCAENNKKVALLVSAEHNAKIEKLEQQLAEKENELEEVKKSKTYIMNFGDKVKEVQES